MKKIYFFVLLLSFTLNSWGQYSLTGANYTQNFNGLGTGTSTNVTGGSLNNVNSSLNGWYFLELGTSANTTITAGTGSSSTSDTYNFGASGDADRALGGLRSGSDVSPVLNPRYGFYFTNNTGSDIEALQITYTGETWRRGFDNRRDRLDFQYSNAATSLSTGTWTNVDALHYSNPVSPLPVGSGSLLHSASINSVILDITIADGASFFIRWIDLDATDVDDGMGIDDFTMTVVDPTPIVFYSKSSGNLTSLGTWGNNADGSGTAPLNFTDNFQEFVVNRTSVTLNANWTVSGVRSKVITGNGSSTTILIIPSSAILTGTIDVSDQATLRLENNTLPSFGTLDDGSTVNFAQTGTFTLPIGSFNNLTITSGAKTLGNGNTTVTGNMVLDAVSSLNGWTGGSSSTIILTGNLTLQNGAAFATTGTLPALEMVGEGTQTLSGGAIRLRSLATTDDPATTLNIALSNANLFLTGSGLELIQSTHRLSLNGNTLNLTGIGVSLGTGDGTISGSSTSSIIIFEQGGSGDIGILRMTPGAQTLGTLEYRDLGSGLPLELGSPLSISTTIVQHFGNDIRTSSTNLLTLLQGAQFTGPGNFSAFILGPLARVTNAATAYWFPVNGKRIFLEIPTPGNVSTFRIEHFETGIHTTVFPCDLEPLSGFKINEYWDISRTSGTSPASFSIEFDGQNLSPADWNQGVPEDGDGIVIAHYVPSIGVGGATADCWENVSPTAPILPFAQTSISTEVLTEFSPFTFGYIDFANGPLPVKFGNVKAYQQGNGVRVDWSNFTESDLVNYKVERSIDGQTFTPISTVNPTLNNGSRADYSYFDAAPFNGVNFYRIQSLEIDGKKVYSVIVRVDTKNDNIKVTVYPNPVTDGQLVLQTPDLKRGVYTVNVFNAVGQLVYNKPINHSGGFVTQSIQLPASLKTGIYNLQLIGDGVKITKTFILQ